MEVEWKEGSNVLSRALDVWNSWCVRPRTVFDPGLMDKLDIWTNLDGSWTHDGSYWIQTQQRGGARCSVVPPV